MKKIKQHKKTLRRSKNDFSITLEKTMLCLSTENIDRHGVIQ